MHATHRCCTGPGKVEKIEREDPHQVNIIENPMMEVNATNFLKNIKHLFLKTQCYL